ncbi:putative Uncharacterized oxidoreductase YjmC [uncultured delta proteobacterium]|uniref:Putative Uncharacterized oxidoreductase YjmC n=1 Tax=uncultured delta proteobacterium TaxID=34034 RepID=A0A212J235_9DELT|nr:putative Uncharacterized oxidoreductase YjmC [uncultured delta proteobacterium]
MRFFRSDALKPLIAANLKKIGVCDDGCFHVSESVIQTSLRGVDSHGITLFPHYHAVAVSGRINKKPSFSHERTGASVAVFDADYGYGHHAGAEAMRLATDIAHETGVGVVSVTHSSHFGAAAYFGFLAAARDMIGLSFTNAPASVVAYNAATSFFGTNPVCVVVPMRDEGPFCLDMATSSMSTNKLANYRRTDTPLEPGWGFDAQGKGTADPHAAKYVGPFGGYKGYGLGMMVEIFCGLLAGGPVATQLETMLKDLHVRRSLSQCFIALDIARFQDTAAFKARLQEMADGIRALPRADAEVPVMIPGDPEKISHANRLVAGIPVDDPMYERFIAIDLAFETALMP